jgi:hypothetical protein
MRCRVRILRNSRGVASGLEKFDGSGLDKVDAHFVDTHLLFHTFHSSIQAPHDSQGPNRKRSSRAGASTVEKDELDDAEAALVNAGDKAATIDQLNRTREHKVLQ